MVQSWPNNDGLLIKFGTDAPGPTIGGEYRTNGALRQLEFVIDLTTLTETETPLSDVVFFPKARIQSVNIITETAAATGVAIDLGLIRTDRSTEIDYNGLLAAFPITSMDAAGETNDIVVGSTYVGALVGTTTTNVGYVSCSRTTATAFTAGKIKVIITYLVI